MTRKPALLSPRHIQWWWAALLAVGMFVVEYLFFVRFRAGQWADEVGFAVWSRWWPSTTLQQPVRQFLDLLPWICGVMAAVFLLYRVIRDRSFLRAIIAIAAAGAAMATTQVLKHAILVRPDFNFGTSGNSFPSGHTTAAAAAMGLMYVMSPPRLRPVVQPVAWIFATATGLATLVCGWHRPSDIAAGFLVAAFWMIVASAVLQRIQPLSHEIGETSWSRTAGILSFITWVVVIVLSLVLPHPHIQKVPEALLISYAFIGIAHVLTVALFSGLLLRSVVIGPARG
ncbi:phosphatase PAP2 family protein [Glutamicibacter sp.]|uniref:phosphatase PAP2 family protein n=1 Tax=Glutamicibacter sp. TaxID=1931995 RepID=UPI0028BD4297|nr:phosphatase PAP2 family protein [Glutamicibacter sp.]